MTADVTDATVTTTPAAEPAAPAGATATGSDELAALRAERDDWKSQARKHEDRDKARKTEVEQRDALLRQLAEKAGIPFDGKPDPAALTSALGEQTRIARARSVELAVFRGAAPAGADANALLDSRAFMDQAQALDPDAADFSDRVAELVTEAAKSPKFAAGKPAADDAGDAAGKAATTSAAKPPAASSGSDFSGAPSGGRQWSQQDYDRAIAAGDVEVINKAIDAGQLRNLGVGRRKPGYRR